MVRGKINRFIKKVLLEQNVQSRALKDRAEHILK